LFGDLKKDILNESFKQPNLPRDTYQWLVGRRRVFHSLSVQACMAAHSQLEGKIGQCHSGGALPIPPFGSHRLHGYWGYKHLQCPVCFLRVSSRDGQQRLEGRSDAAAVI
jgi:hypothetical protein